MAQFNTTSIFSPEYLKILASLSPRAYEERLELFLRLLSNPEEMAFRRREKIFRRRPAEENPAASDAVAIGLAASAWRKAPGSARDFPGLLFLSSGKDRDGRTLRLQTFTGGGMPYKNVLLSAAPCRNLDEIAKLVPDNEDLTLFVDPESFHVILDEPGTLLLKKVSAMIVAGAPAMPLARRLIEDNSRATVAEVFGDTEAGVFAVKVDGVEARVINPDCYVELLNWDGKNAAPGECGEIAVTSLKNSPTPIIRHHPGCHGIRPENSPEGALDRINSPAPALGFQSNSQGAIFSPAALHAAISRYPIYCYGIGHEGNEIRFEYSCPEQERALVESHIPAVAAGFYAPPTTVAMLCKSRASDIAPPAIPDGPYSGRPRLSIARVDRAPGPHSRELLDLILEKCGKIPGAPNGNAFDIRASADFRERCSKNPAFARVLEKLEKTGRRMKTARKGASAPPILLTTPEETDLQHPPQDTHTVYLAKTQDADRETTEDLAIIIPAETARAQGGMILQGVVPEASTRYIAAVPGTARPGREHFRIFHSKCGKCGACETLCPKGCISAPGGRVRIDSTTCVRCYICAEHCRGGAIAPLRAQDTSILISGFAELAALGAAFSSGGLKPAPPHGIKLGPASKRPRKKRQPPADAFSRWDNPFSFYFHVRKKGLYILGLSVVTFQEHSAALIRDGRVLGAVHEERLNRIKHYGWRNPKRPWASMVSDPSLSLEEALPEKSVKWLLKKEGIEPERLDFIALNGIPARMRRTFSAVEIECPPAPLKAGRLLFIPHHLAHASGAYRASGMDEAFILTVDGRGDRETAAFFTASGGRIERVAEILCLNDTSIGGVYETASRALGFGPHGQGAVMALAAMGSPVYDTRNAISANSFGAASIHENEIGRLSAALPPCRTEDPAPEHKNFAASVQKSLEDTVIHLIEDGLERAGAPHGGRGANLCISGGVALNCAMNHAIRKRFEFRSIYIQPAASDAGTSLGAALQAHYLVTGEYSPREIRHDFLGPEFDTDSIRLFLESNRIPYIKSAAVADDSAGIIAAGHVVCWFQGAMEFGPRALGARSILADPRDPAVSLRLNRMKSRQPWRPLAPAIPAGREAEYLDSPERSPFMLFTASVREELRRAVPAIVHTDGSTRPQSVDEDTNPLLHRLILEYERLTGIPMVVNTSFNRGGEPIVCTPAEALESFFGMGGDFLAMGPYIIVNPAVTARLRGGARPESALGYGEAHRSRRRFHLRLTTACNNNCVHCTIRDIRGLPDRSAAEAVREMAAARKSGADEIVFMRGESTLRKDIFTLASAAGKLGFSLIQLQTNARAMSDPRFLERLTGAGVGWFDVALFGDTSDLHDAIARAPGAFNQTVAGLKNIERLGCSALVAVPVIKHNYRRLEQIVELVARLGHRRVQLNFARPIFYGGKWDVESIASLRDSAGYIVRALKKAAALGLAPSTEAVPLCALDEETRRFAEKPLAQGAHSVADLNIKHESFAAHISEARPVAPPCAGCSLVSKCPGVWAAYLQLMGCGELSPAPPE